VPVDPRVTRRYELADEDARLWLPGIGDLVRLRTWDIFDRYVPPTGHVLDVGGGPGTHAAYLAARGHEVTLVDPVDQHVEAAEQRARSVSGPTFTARLGHACELPMPDCSVDVVLLMGPMYHLVDAADRREALREAYRVLRADGVLLAEIICRHSWILDATTKDLLDQPDIWSGFDRCISTGLSQDPANMADGAFWAYFHQPEQLRVELDEAGFAVERLVAVEGFAWLVGDLARRMAAPEALLRAIRLTETEPSMLGASAHVIGVASRGARRHA